MRWVRVGVLRIDRVAPSLTVVLGVRRFACPCIVGGFVGIG